MLVSSPRPMAPAVMLHQLLWAGHVICMPSQNLHKRYPILNSLVEIDYRQKEKLIQGSVPVITAVQSREATLQMAPTTSSPIFSQGSV